MSARWVFLVLVLPFGTQLQAQAPCPVQGTWQLESATMDGQPESVGWSQIKLVTATHFAFVSQQGGASPLQSVADTLSAYRTRFSGGGTYTATPTTYTEKLDFFHNPEYVGRELTFSCRIQGDRWYHAGDYPVLEGGKETRTIRLEEVWRRIG